VFLKLLDQGTEFYMAELPSVHLESNTQGIPIHTLPEILQQPILWPTTVERVLSASERMQLPARLRHAGILVTGAGTSAYAASAVAAAWHNASAIPTTDLLLDSNLNLADVGAVISLARSGNSPESAAVVERIRGIRPDILQFAIVCNENGALSHSGLDGLIVLDPRTNDQSLVMTSAFSNLVLAGLTLAQPDSVAAAVEAFSKRADALLPEIDRACRLVADSVRDRIVILSSPPLLGWGREAGLKTLEMTGGAFPVVTETYLGLRHGPMSFVKRDTLVMCLLSSDPVRRRYEMDLIHELRAKKIGYLVGIVDPRESGDLFDAVIPSIAPEANDALRTPFEILGPQLLGYYLSLRIGLNPDSPSPDGVINRVVQGVRIYNGASSAR
jgi:tagatose-6-phosphate ketose/aldose isomerase